jgi:hypothetical protein
LYAVFEYLGSCRRSLALVVHRYVAFDILLFSWRHITLSGLALRHINEAVPRHRVAGRCILRAFPSMLLCSVAPALCDRSSNFNINQHLNQGNNDSKAERVSRDG